MATIRLCPRCDRVLDLPALDFDGMFGYHQFINGFGFFFLLFFFLLFAFLFFCHEINLFDPKLIQGNFTKVLKIQHGS